MLWDFYDVCLLLYVRWEIITKRVVSIELEEGEGVDNSSMINLTRSIASENAMFEGGEKITQKALLEISFLFPYVRV